MKRLLLNYDVASLYPSLICEYGYSSRNQEDATQYINLKAKRIKAKHSGDKKMASALKLPLNTYYGALGAKYNDLYDIRQCRSVCISGQCALLILIHDLLEVPTLRLVESNTDAVCFEIDEDKLPIAEDILNHWQERYRLELEQDKVLKIVMRDINNYCEIVQTDKGKEVVFKGGCFAGCPSITIDENNIIHTKVKPNIKANSLTICAEAMVKELLFDIPCEDTINKCNDIFRFQMISHLGSTYSQCILEDKNGKQVELQRNNRIYAGKENNGCKIYKIKPDGRKDSLANCPKNPIVDNRNEATIDKINKLWYIKYTKQRLSEFRGKKEIYMEEKLDKLKKDELIAMVKDMKEREESGINMLGNDTCSCERNYNNEISSLLHKIAEFRKSIRQRNFILDSVLPNNLGGKEYASIDQIYQAVQDTCLEVGLDFAFDVQELERFDLGAFKPMTGSPQNVATVRCIATFTDIDNGLSKSYTTIAQGSDSIDKAVSGAASYAFRNWFDRNFTPCIFNGQKLEYAEGVEPKTTVDIAINQANQRKDETPSKPKVFVSPEKKEEIKKEIVATPQKTEDNSDIETLTSLIYEYRELSGNETAGKNKLDAVVKGEYTDLDLQNWMMSFENAIADLKKEN